MSAFESETTSKKPIDEHVQNTLSFVQSHESILHNIDNATRVAIAESSDSHSRPIKIAVDPFERVLPYDLVAVGDEQPIKKVLVVLVFLCDEISQLKDIAETRFYRPLEMFGQNPPDITGNESDENLNNSPGKKEKMIGKFLPLLQELCNFIDRCYSVTVNLIQQSASLVNPKEALFRSTFNHTHIRPLFAALGDLLTVLITLDSIIQQNDLLLDSWQAYKSMIAYVRADPSAFNTNIESITKFERLLVSVDQTVMIGEIYKQCVEQNFEDCVEDDNTVNISVRGNQAFLNGELMHCMKAAIESSLGVIGTNSELNERLTIVGAIGIYALYRRLLPPNVAPDAKLHKVLWGIQKIVPVVILSDMVMWRVGEFLTANAHLEVKKLDPPVPDAYRRQYLLLFDQQLSTRTMSLVAQCKAWMILTESRLQSSLRNEPNPAQLHDLYGSILLKGLSLSKRLSYLIKSCLVMHTSMQVPLNKSALSDLSQLIETLKAMEYTFVRKDKVIAEALIHMQRGLGGGMLSVLVPLRLRLEVRKMDSSQIVLHATIVAIEALLRSSDSLSPCRQITLSLLVEIMVHAPAAVCPEKDALRLQGYTNKMLALANLNKDIASSCETTFLFFHTGILEPIVRSVYLLPTECNRLQYLYSAFEDGIKACQMVMHTDLALFFVNYRTILKDTLRVNIIEPLCRDIETDLRLHIHTKHLDHMHAVNPKTENLRPMRPFLDLAPIRILGLLIDIKNEVTHYLDMNFYNLTTVALHDWRTYSDMRSLAAEKLGLQLMDNYLPMGSLDQGLDVLQIMRNIHVFVSRFTYNMNMQQFVEFRPDKSSKHLNTIKIQSIAASIRQHGLGVLNTTVNFTYQFLSTKFKIFSQFLFDDYIRAHLSREHRWFKKHKNEPAINNMYPYDRALKFTKEIRKLGVNDAGKSFLDQFRILITEIGNALGYVRMVRSASMYYCSEAVKYLPEFEDIISFEDHAGKGVRKMEEDDEGNPVATNERVPGTGANFSEETVRAGKNLDEVIDTLLKNFGEGSDYFKVLVNVFQSVLLTAEHDHLKTFYMIVPALCISWIEASLIAKDAMYKTTRGVTKEMYFTDDGFCVGVAYCLAILKQSRKNEAIHWLDSVKGKLKADTAEHLAAQQRRAVKEAAMLKKKEEAAKRKGSFFGFGGTKKGGEKEEDLEENYEDAEEIHTLQLTSKKLEAHRRETEQLFYSMSGAEIFFRRTDVDT